MTTDYFLKRSIALLYDYRKRKLLNRKVRAILSELPESKGPKYLPRATVKDHFKLWRHFGGKPSASWLKLYVQVSGIYDHRYVPEPVYYNQIEPRLNNKIFSKGSTDKNLYSRLPSFFNVPETLLSNIEGVWYDNSMSVISQSDAEKVIRSNVNFIVKPAVDSGGGRGVAYGGTAHHPLDSVDGLLKDYSQNFIVQKVIDGHPFYRRFCDTSLNTLRILTYRSVTDNKIHIVWTLLRVGISGSITDNQASGGYACGVNSSGCLTGKAIDKFGGVHKSVNDVPLLEGTPLEGFESMTFVAEKVAAHFPYSRLLGLDLCLDANGNSRVIEINNVNNEINFFQMLYGPLFGDYTGEIINWCLSRPRSFMIDYEI